MRIVLVNDWHSERMGYSDNYLPKALASLGHEVHLITSNAQCYFNSPIYKDVFEKFIGPGIVECGVKKVDGYMLHRLPFKEIRGRIHIQGLLPSLRKLKPDVVQTGEITSLVTLEAAVAKLFLGYKLFVECHWHASVFPITTRVSGMKQRLARMKQRLYWAIYNATIGRAVSAVSERCYPISKDSAEIAQRYFGFPEHKISVRSLGVETDLFQPAITPELQQRRSTLRTSLGYLDSDIVCIYTGRLSEEKGPHCLAEAIRLLRAQGLPFKALFMGDGPARYVSKIREVEGCEVHPFVATQDLAQYYQAADIGVWPKQESTSQLDAIACGLPIILSDRVHVTERMEGNGLLYLEGSASSLADCLHEIIDPGLRQKMGGRGRGESPKVLQLEGHRAQVRDRLPICDPGEPQCLRRLDRF